MAGPIFLTHHIDHSIDANGEPENRLFNGIGSVVQKPLKTIEYNGTLIKNYGSFHRGKFFTTVEVWCQRSKHFVKKNICTNIADDIYMKE